LAAPARFNALAAAPAVAPVVMMSSMSTILRPAMRDFMAAGTAKAPRTLSRRSLRVRPT
jgi:hypothetical protein